MNNTDPGRQTPSSCQASPFDACPLCPLPRRGIPKPSVTVLFVFLTVSLSMIPVGLWGYLSESRPVRTVVGVVSAVVLIVLTAYLWRAGKAVRAMIPLMILSDVFFIFTFRSPILAAVFSSWIFSVGIGAFLIAVADKFLATWMPLLPVIAYGISAAVLRDPVGAAACLVPVPAALALAFATRASAGRKTGPTRVGVICATSLTVILIMVAAAAVGLYVQLGTLQPAAVSELLESYRESWIQSLAALELPTMSEDGKVIMEVVGPDRAVTAINGFVNLLPSLVIISCNLLSAMAQMILHAAVTAFGYGDSLTPRVKVFRMSFMAGIMFLVASIVTLTSDPFETTLIGTVGENLAAILMPGLALAGMLRLSGAFARSGMRRMGCLFFLLLLVPCLLVIAPQALAVYESIAVILNLFIRPKNRPGDGNPSGSDHPSDGGDEPPSSDR